MKTGLTSVTFRGKSVDEIISIVKESNLDGIEWGSDIHVPVDSVDFAVEVKEKCSLANLQILSYGSYYRALPEQDFAPILEVAQALGVPTIRIWAGNKNPDQITDEYYAELVANIQNSADMAAKKGIRLAFEYHRGTMTQTKEGALKILKDVNHENVGTYWQPNPDVSVEEHMAEIKLLKDYICTYHVFAWEGKTKLNLEEHKDVWQQYINEIGDTNLILEFVKDDSDENFKKDAKALLDLTQNKKDNKKNAVFLNDGDMVFDVFARDTLDELDKHFNLPRFVLSYETFKNYKETLKNVEYVFSTWKMVQLSEDEIKEYLPNLKAVFYGAGSVQKFARPFLNCGVKVFSAWGANAIPVAEFTVAQIILATKGYFQDCRKYRLYGKQVARTYPPKMTGNYNIKVGILGAGMIGKKVMELLKPYKIDVLVFDPFVSQEVLDMYGAKRAELDELFSECQVITNHIANLPTTEGLFRYEHFSKMKSTATFINTGRSPQIIQEDLIRALNEEVDRTALLDVEEPVGDNPLLSMENVFLSNHIAGSMNNEIARMGEYMLIEAEKFIHDKPCEYEVSMKMLESMA